MTTILNNGLTGLLASQAALSVTSNNIANVNTAGYSRQQIVLNAVKGGEYGAGVAVQGVRRIADQYLVNQVWSSATASSFQETQSRYFKQVEQVFGSDASNISKGLDNLFNAFSSNLLNPDDQATRQSVINESKNLSLRFNAINNGLQSQFEQIETQLKASAKQTNVYLHEVARLNDEIKTQGGTSNAAPALLDERDKVIAELSRLMDLSVTERSDGAVSITLAQGQPLVVGSSAASLSVTPDPSKPEFGRLGLKYDGANFELAQFVGGSLGGLLDYRDNNLTESKAFIDELAAKVASEINTVLGAGKDLKGAAPSLTLFSVDATNPAGTLRVTAGFTADKLAFAKEGTLLAPVPGDNSNLKDLIAIQHKKLSFTSISANTDLGSAFVSRVGELGSRSQQAQLDESSASQSLKRAQREWASVSGVNQDEEGASLIRYQRAYQANAKVVAAAGRLFDTLLKSF